MESPELSIAFVETAFVERWTHTVSRLSLNEEMNEYCVVHAVLEFVVTENQPIFPLVPVKTLPLQLLCLAVGSRHGMWHDVWQSRDRAQWGLIHGLDADTAVRK